MGDRVREKIILTQVFVTKDGEERKKKLMEKAIKLNYMEILVLPRCKIIAEKRYLNGL